jgi:hypothetical protein
MISVKLLLLFIAISYDVNLFLYTPLILICEFACNTVMSYFRRNNFFMNAKELNLYLLGLLLFSINLSITGLKIFYTLYLSKYKLLNNYVCKPIIALVNFDIGIENSIYNFLYFIFESIRNFIFPYQKILGDDLKKLKSILSTNLKLFKLLKANTLDEKHLELINSQEIIINNYLKSLSEGKSKHSDLMNLIKQNN